MGILSHPHFETGPHSSLNKTDGKASSPSRFLPGLDGLRAISIGLVIVGHAALTAGFPHWIPLGIAYHAHVGVRIFFVISGYLITKLLLDEIKGSGGIDLKLFYARRALRIFPAMYFYLAGVILLSSGGWITVPVSSLWHAATYTTNYLNNGSRWTGHLWSLSVEEQFYLVWPLLLILTRVRVLTAYLAATCIAIPIALWVAASLRLYDTVAAAPWFPTHTHYLASGCLLACCLPKLLEQQRFRRALRHPAGVAVIPIVIFVLDLPVIQDRPRLSMPIVDWLILAGVSYYIARITTFADTVDGLFLNHPVVVWVGRLSYSLYLWQQLFTQPRLNFPLTSFPLNVVCSFAAAAVSFYVVERPLNSYRARLRPRARTSVLTQVT